MPYCPSLLQILDLNSGEPPGRLPAECGWHVTTPSTALLRLTRAWHQELRHSMESLTLSARLLSIASPSLYLELSMDF